MDLSQTSHQIYDTGKQPKHYAKGPDVMSKSKRSQEHYQKQNKDQTSLTSHFGFTSTKSVKASVMTLMPTPLASGSRAQSASVLSHPSTYDASDREEDHKDC